MRKWWFTSILGVIVFLLPMLGFPRGFDNTIYIISGFLLILFSLWNIRRDYVRDHKFDPSANTNTHAEPEV